MSNDNKSVTVKSLAYTPAIQEKFAMALGNSNAGPYIQSILLAVANDPKLQQCEPMSVITAALEAASLSLSCDPHLKQAYLVPYGRTATLVPGYKGLLDLAVRTGRYRYIHVHPLRGEQTVEFDPFTGKPSIVGSASVMEDITGWMASFEMYDGYSKTIYMSKADIHAHAEEHAPGYKRAGGPWQKYPAAMERKTVLRKLLTEWGYMDPAAAAFLSGDREGSVIEDFDYDAVVEPVDVTAGKTADQLIEEIAP